VIIVFFIESLRLPSTSFFLNIFFRINAVFLKRFGWTAFFAACQSGNLDVCNWFLDRGEHIEATYKVPVRE
jgi:hypothetical protein